MRQFLSTSSVISIVVIYALIPGISALAQESSGKISQTKPMIEIQASLKSRSKELVTLEVAVKNEGSVAVYLVTDAQRVDRSKGLYVDTDSTDPSMLVCTLQFYGPDPFNPFVNGTGVHLLRLEPGESHAELVELPFPLRTTEPPFASSPGTRAIPAGSIKGIQVRVGVLPVSASLTELISRKGIPHNAFTGMERIAAGSTKKSLYEIQEVVRSNVILISFD